MLEFDEEAVLAVEAVHVRCCEFVIFRGPLSLFDVMTFREAIEKLASRGCKKLDGAFGTDTTIEPLTCDADCACQ